MQRNKNHCEVYSQGYKVGREKGQVKEHRKGQAGELLKTARAVVGQE